MLVYADESSAATRRSNSISQQSKRSLQNPDIPAMALPLEKVRGTHVDIAYAGSCTAGDITSIAMYAAVLKGRKVRIPTYIQYGSERVREEARRRGIHDILVGGRCPND